MQATKQRIERERIERVVASVRPDALHAVETAARIAAGHGGRLALVYALGPLAIPPGAEESALFQREESVVAKQRMSETARSVASTHLEPDILVRAGSAAGAVEAVVRDYGADLVVVGAHRRAERWSAFSNRFFRNLVARLRCPILAVHPEDRAELDGSGLRVLTAASSASAAGVVASLASRTVDPGGDTHVRLVRVVPGPEAFRAPLGHEAENIRYMRERLTEEQRLVDEAERLRSQGGLDASAVVRSGSLAAVARAESRDFGADLIAVRGAAWMRGGGIGPSPLARLAAAASCPVLSV